LPIHIFQVNRYEFALFSQLSGTTLNKSSDHQTEIHSCRSYTWPTPSTRIRYAISRNCRLWLCYCWCLWVKKRKDRGVLTMWNIWHELLKKQDSETKSIFIERNKCWKINNHCLEVSKILKGKEQSLAFM